MYLGCPLQKRALQKISKEENIKANILQTVKFKDLLYAFGTAWVCPRLVKDLLLSWMLFPVAKKENTLWGAAPLILCLAI